MRRADLAFVAAVAGCASAPPAEDFGARPLQGHATRFRTSGDGLCRAALVRYQMARSLDDLRAIQRALAFGELAVARTRAGMIASPIRDPGLAAWRDDADAVVAAARAVERATTLDNACAAAGALATACRGCHVRAGAVRPFATVAAPLAPEARRAWAIDRMLDGVVGPDDRSWRLGLAALAEPAPPAELPLLAARLEEVARDTGPEASATAYASVLVACAACHRRTRELRDAVARGEGAR
jgi:hypothetical protein